MNNEVNRLEKIGTDPRTRMEEFLAQQPEVIRERVKRTIEIWGIDREDPYFLLLIQCRITQIFYELMPSRLNQEFDSGLKAIETTLDNYRHELLKLQQSKLEEHAQAALKMSTAKLNSAIANILEDNNLNSQKRTLSPRVIGSIVTAGAMFFGLFVGGTVGVLFDRTNIAQNWRDRQNTEDRMLLDWAKSNQGKFARNLLEWNDDLADKSCQKKAENLGISFKVGSLKITDGFCVVFVVP